MPINVYKSQIGLPNPVVTARPADPTSLLRGISQVGQTISAFSQKYQQAQFLTDQTDAQLEISKRTNAYFEDLAQTPIRANPGEDIVELKEKSWNDFADDLQKNYIGKLDNETLKENLTAWWRGTSETQRHTVFNNAQAENVQYMGERMTENIEDITNTASLGVTYNPAKNEFEGLEGFQIAFDVEVEGERTGLWGREGSHDIKSFIKQRRSLAEATAVGKSVGYDESIEYMNQQTQLTNAAKQENIQILRENEKARLLAEAEGIKVRDESLMKTAGTQIFTGSYTTIDDLNKQLQYGALNVLSGDDQENLRRDWYYWEGQREDGLDDDKKKQSDPAAMLDLGKLSVTGTPTEFANALRKYRDEDKIVAKDYITQSEMLFAKREAGTTVFNPVVESVLKKINNLDPEIWTDSDKLELQNNFTQYAESDALGDIRPDNQNLQDIDALNQWLDNQITEKGNIKFEDSIRQIYGSQAKFFRDIRTISGFEELAIEAEEGKLIGFGQPELVSKYFENPTEATEADIQQDLSRNFYGKSYEELNDIQRSNVDRNMGVMTFTSSGKQLAIEELGIPADKIRISMNRDGYPQYQNEETGDVFSLKMESKDRKILAWYKYFGTRNGEDLWHIYKTVEPPPKDPVTGEDIKVPLTSGSSVQNLLQYTDRDMLPVAPVGRAQFADPRLGK